MRAFLLFAITLISLTPGLLPQTHAQGVPPGVRALRDLAYVDHGHDRQKLDLYLPDSAVSGAPLPLIIWIHGGGWKSGDKRQCPAIRFAREGYAVASIGYRLSEDAVFPAQIEDCKAAIRWLRVHAAEYHLDPDRFAAWGSSAGGHLVALLGVTGKTREFDVGANLKTSSAVQLVIDFYGPADFLTMGSMSGPQSRLDHDAPDSPEAKLLGGAIQKNPGLARRASPITYVQAGAPPFLIVHGDADQTVPVGQSKLLDEKLRAAGNRSTLHIVKGGGHGTLFGPEVFRLTEDFLNTHLKPVAQ
ncbi:MAG TPA: alpha/beta hydrolase [Rariglobus sp.]|jgi:acetyl esterase/lipase|nr:alpha/beta hydrolase [Rariglobus sp.]